MSRTARSVSRWRTSRRARQRAGVETAALALGAAVTLPEVTFHVKPGTTYELTVEAVPPAGQSLTADTVLQQALQVSPAT